VPGSGHSTTTNSEEESVLDYSNRKGRQGKRKSETKQLLYIRDKFSIAPVILKHGKINKAQQVQANNKRSNRKGIGVPT